jgi:3-phenylpropionate/trans-cinnamate dioxygenase ferredoxin subunit
MAKTIIKATPDGPYQVSGEVEITDAKGNTVSKMPYRDVFLCRCGNSKKKPLCDGSHKKINFQDS